MHARFRTDPAIVADHRVRADPCAWSDPHAFADHDVWLDYDIAGELASGTNHGGRMNPGGRPVLGVQLLEQLRDRAMDIFHDDSWTLIFHAPREGFRDHHDTRRRPLKIGGVFGVSNKS